MSCYEVALLLVRKPHTIQYWVKQYDKVVKEFFLFDAGFNLYLTLDNQYPYDNKHFQN